MIPSLPPDAPESGPSPATEAELRVLVKRLEDFMTSYLEIGEKLDVDPEPEAVLNVVDRAIAHADEVPWNGPQVPGTSWRALSGDARGGDRAGRGQCVAGRGQGDGGVVRELLVPVVCLCAPQRAQP